MLQSIKNTMVQLSQYYIMDVEHYKLLYILTSDWVLRTVLTGKYLLFCIFHPFLPHKRAKMQILTCNHSAKHQFAGRNIPQTTTPNSLLRQACVDSLRE